MKVPKILAALLAIPVALVAQDPLRIAGFDELTITWQQFSEAKDVAIRYDELAGEYTLLLTHTSIDETVAGSVVAATERP